MGLIPIEMGEKGKSPMIKRADVAQGTKGRALLIDPNPRVAIIAFDEENRIAFHADQKAIIKYKLRGNIYYLLLIARLNTDMRGEVIGDDIIVEYLRLNENVYSEIADQIEEMGEAKSLLLKKESKGEYSFVKPVVSKKEVPNEIVEKLQSMDLEALWDLVESDVARPLSSYLKAIGETPEMPKNTVSNAKAVSSKPSSKGLKGPEETKEEKSEETTDKAEDTEFEEDDFADD